MTHITSGDAASTLGWLVTAGADALVTEATRNWLAVPAAAPPPSPAVRAAAAPAGIAPAPPAAISAADFAALDAALGEFAHPLRRAGIAPQLLTGNSASGLVILSDQPEPDDTPADRLTVRMLAAIGLAADSCARAHLLPWTIPGGRPPRDAEIADFEPFRARAFELATPRLILALGDRAAALAGEARGVAALRGKWLAIAGVPMLATFHPRTLLAQPDLKHLAWADLQAFAERMSE